MSGIDDRKSAMEAMLRLSDENKFKAAMRRDRLLAQWAAEKLGCTDTEAYVQEVITADLATPGDQDVCDKVAVDVASLGITAEQVRAQLDGFQARAVREIEQFGG